MLWHFLLNLLTIVVVNLALSGDNGVAIAWAVNTLPEELRIRAMLGGAASAIVVLTIATLFAAPLLQIRLLQSVGGIFILWIGVKLFRHAVSPEAPAARPSRCSKAIWLITVAEVTTSLDNILSIAAIAQGDFALLVFGFGLSVPFVFLASGFLTTMMDKYPATCYLGAAALGRIGGKMIITDSFTVRTFHPTVFMRYGVEVTAAIGVLVAGRYFWREKQLPIRGSKNHTGLRAWSRAKKKCERGKVTVLFQTTLSLKAAKTRMMICRLSIKKRIECLRIPSRHE